MELRAFLLLGTFLLATGSARAQEIDRLLAAVNGAVITESDLHLARRLKALVALGRAPAEGSRQEEINRVIDLELLRQELRNSPGVEADPARLDAEIGDLANAYTEIGGLAALLGRLGLEAQELRAYAALRIAVENFVNSRFRPFAAATSEEKQAYYRETLAPTLERAGARVPPFDEVEAGIARVIEEQKMNDSLDRWLGELRRHARIELFGGATAAEAGR